MADRHAHQYRDRKGKAMKIDKFRRGPDGKFVPYGDELEAWFPTLANMGYGDAVGRVLPLLVAHCEARAAKELELAAKYLTIWRQREHLLDEPSQHPIKAYERFLKRRRVLVEAIAKLKEIDGPEDQR